MIHLLGFDEEFLLSTFGVQQPLKNKQYRIEGADYVKENYSGSYKGFVRALFTLSGDRMATVSPAFWGSVEDRAPIFEQSPSTWEVLTFGGEIVGNWQFVCLKREAFTKAMNRQLLDSELTVQDIDFPILADNYPAYFTALFVDQRHDTPGAYAKIFRSISKKLESFGQEGVFLSDIVTHAVTPAGKRICERLGFTPLGKHIASQDPDGVECFHMSGATLGRSLLGKQSPNLKEMYSTRFG